MQKRFGTHPAADVNRRDGMGNQPQRLRAILADEPLLLTPEEAASVLRVGRTTVYALMKSGDLHAVHIGRSCRLSRADLERYATALTWPSGRRLQRRAVAGGPARIKANCSTPSPSRSPDRDLWMPASRCRDGPRHSAAVQTMSEGSHR